MFNIRETILGKTVEEEIMNSVDCSGTFWPDQLQAAIHLQLSGQISSNLRFTCNFLDKSIQSMDPSGRFSP